MNKVRRSVVIRKIAKRLKKKGHDIRIRTIIRNPRGGIGIYKTFRIEYECVNCNFTSCAPCNTSWSRRYEKAMKKHAFKMGDISMNCKERQINLIQEW